jgi:hypothetical protein
VNCKCSFTKTLQYVSGGNITHLEEGRSLFVRTPESRFTLANFMRADLFSALGALKISAPRRFWLNIVFSN